MHFKHLPFELMWLFGREGMNRNRHWAVIANSCRLGEHFNRVAKLLELELNYYDQA